MKIYIVHVVRLSFKDALEGKRFVPDQGRRNNSLHDLFTLANVKYCLIDEPRV